MWPETEGHLDTWGQGTVVLALVGEANELESQDHLWASAPCR